MFGIYSKANKLTKNINKINLRADYSLDDCRCVENHKLPNS